MTEPSKKKATAPSTESGSRPMSKQTPSKDEAVPSTKAAPTKTLSKPSQPTQEAKKKPASSKSSTQKSTKKSARKTSATSELLSLTLGEFAHYTIREQYQKFVDQEKQVIADNDPENLHQMRVWSRRLYTALQVFEPVISLPKAARAKRVRRLTKVLGKLRDLDVQLQTLQDSYLPELSDSEQPQLKRVMEGLGQKRRKALAGTRDVLSQSRYENLKLAYEAWLAEPRLNPQASLPLGVILPDLLSPLLAETLSHPGWLISADSLSDDEAAMLHDLRKSCKHLRYQAEFFTPIYGKAFKSWIKGLKELQDTLGQLQDLEVLRQQLHSHHVKLVEMPDLQHKIQATYSQVLAEWEKLRQPYLDRDFRYGLYQMLLEPA